MCPADYPYLYMNKFEQTNILAGHKKHWRRVLIELLCTYLISTRSILKKALGRFMKKCCLNRF